MTCSTCKFYTGTVCRRFPHSISKQAGDWCGEHKTHQVPRKLKKLSYSDSFNKFWAIYPRKIGKDNALVAWNKVDQPEAIIRAAQAWSTYWIAEKQDPKYIKHPATFINSGDWRDLPEAKYNPKMCACGMLGVKWEIINGNKIWKCTACRRAG